MDHLLIALLVVGTSLLSLAAAGHALLYKLDSRSALVWTSLNLTLPIVGPFLYWCLGINRISRRARSWQESGRRISGTSIYPLDDLYQSVLHLPAAASHFADLRVLGDHVVTTPLRSGNQIELHENGDIAYPAMLAAISRAEKNINLSSYIFDADGIGADFVNRLIDAAERGVAVRVIIDALGEKYSTISPVKAFKNSRVRIERYLPLRHGAYINLRNHRKLMIIDGRTAFTGGMNIRGKHILATTAPDQAVLDIHFSINGPVVSDLQRSFLEDWFFVTGERLDSPLFFPPLDAPGNAYMRCISDGPDKEFRKLEQLIMGALSCATHSVYIMTPYFIPDRSLISALITTALLGVEVCIVLPGCNNLPFVQWASQSLLRELVVNGIKVYYQPPPFVHTKLMLIDDIWALIGSANLDTRSLRLNFELNLSVIDAAFARSVRSHFERALAPAREITLHILENRPLPIQLRDSFCHLFAPYL
ncbi:MAG: phospholipase D-like domain-containing protein [Desulfuromonadaceae bacterium]|nr:phospholipase D-like domain-containing protein [Desulfuromonadaceae bacterium]